MVSEGRITADHRVADVLALDEGLVDVFENVSPAFGRLRNPGLRKVMARLVTVGQAARVAGVDAAELLQRLNAAVGAPATVSEDNVEADMAPPAARPASIADLSEELILELDVRPDLREGREPFSRIMAAKRDVPVGGALRLRAIFEPAPLYAVLGKQGWQHWTEQRGPDDWVVWFYRADHEGPDGHSVAAGGGEARAGGESDAAADPEASGKPVGAGEGGDGVIVLDVRGMEPPEPMVRTLAALESLPRGDTLVQINVREPRFLLPQLEERGFEYEVREQAEDLVRVFIRHADQSAEE